MMLPKRPMRFFTSPFSYLAARMRKREACCGREQFPVRYNKAVRASSIRRRNGAARACAFQRTRHGLSDLKAELLAFPNGRHDDIVDALGLCGQLIDK